MPDYHLEGPKPARMFEVFLPKKLGYFGKVQRVLEDLFSEDAIRAIPFVQRTIARNRRDNPAFDEDEWIKTLSRASRGYSIYEMDGRYLSPVGPVDERVLVIRLIFHNPRHSEPAQSPDASSRHPRPIDALAVSQEVVNHLIAHRFADELGAEDEIWFVEFPATQLAIWHKHPSDARSSTT